jgi:hypothetical protein
METVSYNDITAVGEKELCGRTAWRWVLDVRVRVTATYTLTYAQPCAPSL